MHSLPLYHRLTGQKVILLAEGEAGEAKRRLLERAGAVIVGEDNAEARLAFVATEAPEAAVERLRARGLLLNVTDRPDLCDFTVPSILERGPVLIAVGTGGVSAGLAKALRMRLEGILPQSLGALADALGNARERLRAIWPEAATRRKQIDAALAPGGLLDPLRDFDADRFGEWLDAASSGSLFGYWTKLEITLNSNDPDDLTVRNARSLANADLIIHDPSVPRVILAMARADAARCLAGEEPPAGSYPLTVILRRG
jgi:uroporphyrin-III C-methyltransferase / precorrin-2 dehydrogenase / sirohydrochlorin ferrochelatase